MYIFVGIGIGVGIVAIGAVGALLYRKKYNEAMKQVLPCLKSVAKSECESMICDLMKVIDSTSYLSCEEYVDTILTGVLPQLQDATLDNVKLYSNLKIKEKWVDKIVYSYTIEDYLTYCDPALVPKVVKHYVESMVSKIHRMEEEDLQVQAINESYEKGEPIEPVAPYHGEYDKSDYEIEREQFIPHKPSEEDLLSIEEPVEEERWEVLEEESAPIRGMTNTVTDAMKAQGGIIVK